MNAILSGIFIYPVKSLSGISLEESVVTATGLENDRLRMLVDEHGNFMTLRNFRNMSAIKVSYHEGRLTFRDRYKTENTITLLPGNPGHKVKVRIWSDECDAEEESDEVSQWLSDFLSVRCRLVRIDSLRKVNPKFGKGHSTAFTDGYPVLLCSEDSLEMLNRRLDLPAEMMRFRPNLVLSGLPAFAEDNFKKFRLGEVEFEAVKPCSRCVIVNMDPQSGKVSKEVLAALAGFRREGNEVNFGQNLLVHSEGTLRAGDTIDFTLSKNF